MEEKDYKKLYEDVVALAKDGLKDGLYLSQSAKAVTEFLFPQLKETEDEKVKRELTRFLINFNNGYYSKPSETEIDSWIKWIKKQDEQKTEIKYVYPKFRIGDVIEPINPNGFYRPVRVLSIEEKTESYYCESDDKKSFSSIPIRCENEYKLVEQKSADEVGPKFKVGDWCIDNEDNTIFQITKVLSNLYYYRTNEGKEYSCTRDSIERDAHLWTIQDAKDGDVLATKKGNPFIYDKDRYNNGLAYYYAGLDVNKELTLKSPHHMLAHFGELHSVSPATKEQRDILFQKMKEEGYEWNAEKKELRKIEQNSSWSKEDEQNLKGIIATMEEDAQLPKDTIKRLCKWLKCIKDRVQPKQEWSKEHFIARQLFKLFD